MHISWHGQYTVSLQAGPMTVLLDPYSPQVGLSPWKGTAQVIAFTNPSEASMSFTERVSGEPFVIDRPGEYSLGNGISLKAMGWYLAGGEERILQRWTLEDMTLLHVGALNRQLEATELQELEKTDLDILLLPVGGGSGLNTHEALALVSTLEPRVVIPIHYHLSGIKETLDDVTQFAKEMGIDPQQREKKFIVKQNKLPTEGMLTVLLTP